MKCPNHSCNKEDLKKIIIAGIEADYCPKCFGMWFESGELDSAKDKKDFSLRFIDIDLWKDKKDFRASQEKRICPKDRSWLYQVEYSDSDIKVDVCNLCHGIWLDRGEFEKIIDYLKAHNKEDLMKNYSKVLAQEAWEVFSGPKELREELIDLVFVLKILQYKFIAQNDWVKRMIMALPKL